MYAKVSARLMMGDFTVLILPVLAIFSVILIDWKWRYSDVHLQDYWQADRFNVVILICSLLVIVIPTGWIFFILLITSGLVLHALNSKDERQIWRNRWKVRTAVIMSILVCIPISGFVPVTEPIDVPEWGIPIVNENPDAPSWPKSEQHIWVDGATILVVNHVRFPGAFSPMGSGSMILWHLENSDVDEERLKLAIEQLEDIGLQSEWFDLRTTASGQSHTYNETLLPYSIKNIEVSGSKIAEMVTVAMGMWGGEIRLLTIIKPSIPGLSQSPFHHDPYAEQEVNTWLEVNV